MSSRLSTPISIKSNICPQSRLDKGRLANIISLTDSTIDQTRTNEKVKKSRNCILSKALSGLAYNRQTKPEWRRWKQITGKHHDEIPLGG